MITTVIYFDGIYPLKVPGYQTLITLDYITEYNEDAYSYTVISGIDYVNSVEIDHANKKLKVYLKKYVITPTDSAYNTRDIVIRLGNESYYDNAVIRQQKVKELLTFDTPYITDKGTDFVINYKLNDEHYNSTDINIVLPAANRLPSITTFHQGFINANGEIQDVPGYSITDKFYYNIDFHTVKVHDYFTTPDDILYVAIFMGDTMISKFETNYEDLPYISSNPTSDVFDKLIQDALTNIDVDEAYIVVGCADNAIGTELYCYSTATNIVDRSANQGGTIDIKLMPNFTPYPIITDVTATVTDKTTGYLHTATASITQSVEYDDMPYIINPEYIAKLKPNVEYYNPTTVDYWNLYLPLDWDVMATNYDGRSYFLAEAEPDRERISVKESRAIKPTLDTKGEWDVFVKFKRSEADDVEYDVNVTTLKAEYNFNTAGFDTTTITVDANGFNSSVITFSNPLQMFDIVDYEFSGFVGLTENDLIHSLINNNISLSVKQLEKNTSHVDIDRYFDITVMWSNGSSQKYFITVNQAADTSYEEVPISQKTTYYMGDDELYYRLLDLESKEVIYVGKVMKECSNEVVVNDIAKDYINVTEYPFTSMFVDNNNYYNVMLQTSNDGNSWNDVKKYYFFYRYNDDPTVIDTLGLISIEHQVVDYYSPYQYFITSRQYFNSIDATNVDIQLKQLYVEDPIIKNFGDYNPGVYSFVISCDLYEEIDVSYIRQRPVIYKYVQKCVDSDYVLYYLNSDGGWNWMFYDGKNITSNNITRNTYINGNSKFAYKNNITKSYDLVTKYLTDEQSEKLQEIYKSPCVYIQKLDSFTEPIRVNVDTNSYQIKTYVNQGKKFFTQSIKVTEAETKEWLL